MMMCNEKLKYLQFEKEQFSKPFIQLPFISNTVLLTKGSDQSQFPVSATNSPIQSVRCEIRGPVASALKHVERERC